MARTLAGWAGADITPPVGLPMGGYELRKGPAVDVAKPLEAGFVLFADSAQGPFAAIMVFDLERLGSLAVQAVKENLAKLGLPPRAVLVLCTHTHSSPLYNLEKRGIGTGYEKNKELEKYYLKTLPSLAEEMYVAARRSLRPVRALYARIKVQGVGSNRHDGSPSAAPWLHTAAFFHGGEDAEPGLLLANYACHPTVLGAENMLYSPDFPGYFREGLSAAFNSRPPVIFTNGAAGDISTRYTRREQTEKECRRLGLLLASLAKESLKTAKQVKLSPIRFQTAGLTLLTRAFPSAVESDALAAKALLAYKEASRANAAQPVLRRLLTIWQGAEITARYAKQGLTGSISSEIQGIRLGDLLFLGVPGELYASGDAAIRKELEGENISVMVCGFANDYLGYFVDGKNAGNEYENLATPFRKGSYKHLLAEIAKLGAELLT